MADMHTALTARLLDDAAVAAIAGNDVHWVTRPQGSDLPAVTLSVVAGSRDVHLKGYSGLRSTDVQADCWAASFAEAKALVEAVIAATAAPGVFGGIKFGRTVAGEPRDLGDDATGAFIHRQSVDLTVSHYSEEG